MNPVPQGRVTHIQPVLFENLADLLDGLLLLPQLQNGFCLSIQFGIATDTHGKPIFTDVGEVNTDIGFE
ncbi:MAG: hypothetical protein BGO12_21360 [Verrucomicrobia bacterium 61-8]|nr:MAG: hypothetical protein BGO12_21360 [Verrucomicrobia bacterium 61-8]